MKNPTNRQLVITAVVIVLAGLLGLAMFGPTGEDAAEAIGHFEQEPYDTRPGYSERSFTDKDVANIFEAALSEEEPQEGELVPEEVVTEGMPCVYVARWNTMGFYDREGLRWNGIAYDAGAFALVEETSQVMKVVALNRSGERQYLYFASGDMARDSEETMWHTTLARNDEDPTIEPEVPCQQS